MAGTGGEENGEKLIRNGVDQVYGFPVYITKEAEAMVLCPYRQEKNISGDEVLGCCDLATSLHCRLMLSVCST